MKHFVQNLAAFTVTLLLVPMVSGAPLDGFTEPYRKIEVAASETGIVAQLLVHEGDRVSKSQSLAILDNDVLEVSREIAETSARAKGKLGSATADRDLRKTRLDRLQPLLAEGHASQEEVDRARAEMSVAEANLLAVEEQHRLDELERKKIEAMIERRTLRSPIDGVVLKIMKDEHEFVSVTSASVMTVVQLDPLRVIFSAPTATAAKLTAGSTVDLELPDNGSKVRGKVELVAPVTEAESGTVRVKVLIDNPQGVYRCGVRCLLNLDPVPKDEKPAKLLKAGTIQK